MRTLLIILCILLAVQSSLWGYDIDSMQLQLKKAANTEEKADILSIIAFDLSHTQPDSALTIAKTALAMLNPKKNTRPLGNCYNSIGWAFFELGKMDIAEANLLKAVTIFTAIGDKEKEANSLANLGDIYESQKNYEKALQFLLKAMQLLSTTNNELSKAYIEKLIGTIYSEEGYDDKAAVYLRSAISNFKKLQNWRNMAGAQLSLANIYVRAKQYDSVFIYYRAALVTNSLANDLVNTAYIYENIGNAYATMAAQGKGPVTDSPLIYFRLAYNIFLRLGNQQDIAYEKLKIGTALDMLKRYKEARVYLEAALNTFDSLQAVNYSYDAAAELSESYKGMHDYQKAFAYLQKANVYNDTLRERNKNELVADMLVKYESDKKDRSIALLNAQKKLAEHELSRTRLIESFTIISVLLAIALGLALMNRYRVKQKLKELQLRNQISGDLHDDIGSSLSSILLLSKMAATDTPGRPELLNRIGSNAQEVIERVSDIIWATNPKYDAGETLREKIESYITQIEQMSGIVVAGHITEGINTINFSTGMRRDIFLIIKEAVNNILKHAKATQISIDLSIQQKTLCIAIADNGTGFDIHMADKGNGLTTMQQRAKSIGGTLHIGTEQSKGTTITVKAPLPHFRYKLSF